MKFMKICLLIALVFLRGTVALAEDPFSVRIVEVAEEVPLGVHPSIMIEVRNTSGKTQPMAFSRARVGVTILVSPGDRDADVGRIDCGRNQHKGILVFADAEPLVSADWVFRRRLWVPVYTPGQYTARAYFSVRSGATKHIGEPEEHWAGKTFSEAVTVRLVLTQRRFPS